MGGAGAEAREESIRKELARLPPALVKKDSGERSEDPHFIYQHVKGTTGVKEAGVAIYIAVNDARREGKDVVVRAMGASAVNQAVKAMIEAAGHLIKKCGIDLGVKPYWESLEIPDEYDRDKMVRRSVLAFRIVDLNRRGAL